MTRTSLRAKALACTFLATAALAAAPARASSPHPNVDANGVDLTDGSFNLALPIATVGSGQGALSLVAYDGQTDNWTQAYVSRAPAGGNILYRVVLGNRYDDFTLAATDASGSSTDGTGARLEITGDNSVTYTTLEGVVYSFVGEETEGLVTNLCSSLTTGSCVLLAQSVAGKSGLEATYEWTISESCGTVHNPDGTLNCNATWRLARVSNNAGYAIAWTYAADYLTSTTSAAWKQRTSAALTNGAATVATVTYANPSSGVYTIATPGGKIWPADRNRLSRGQQGALRL